MIKFSLILNTNIKSTNEFGCLQIIWELSIYKLLKRVFINYFIGARSEKERDGHDVINYPWLTGGTPSSDWELMK